MWLDTRTVYLLLGSNLGERERLINDAIFRIGKEVGKVKARSAFYATDAWGKEDQPEFLNVAVAVETSLSALEVLEKILSIENELGRLRHEKWGARLIDIDLILYADEVIDIEDKLQVPHREMHKRRFVLVPMVEIAGNVEHPVLKSKIFELLESLTDNLKVLKV